MKKNVTHGILKAGIVPPTTNKNVSKGEVAAFKRCSSIPSRWGMNSNHVGFACRNELFSQQEDNFISTLTNELNACKLL
jgi:hypothetical protein